MLRIQSKEAKRKLANYLRRTNPAHLEFLTVCGKTFGTDTTIILPEDAELRKILEEI